ncbi:MAG: glycosyltransferase [Muribaculaceae bacterium]|nr:glycosyltransferase [Muribaculaceae bacterium]
MADTKLKITLINHSDTRGGASIVTYRLMNALRREGVDARMVVVHKATEALCVAEATTKPRVKAAFIAEHVDILLNNGFNRNSLFKISTGRFGLPVWRHPWVLEADVVVVNWVNQGMMSLKGVKRLSARKPLIWIMHDMWNMTGVCHYAADCTAYLTGCRDCPVVGRGRLAHKVFKDKERLYRKADIAFVAVSKRLAELCEHSTLMSKCDIRVIPNALPIEQFGVTPSLTREKLGLPERQRLIVMGAARLDDAVKNLPLAIEALNNVTTPDVTVVFYGDIRNPELLAALRLPYVNLGHLSKVEDIQSVMAHASVVLSTSVWETLPTTLAEGIATGATGVATTNGGQSDIIDEGVTGFLVNVEGKEPTEAAKHIGDALDRALELPFDIETRQMRHRLMAQRFSPSAIARKYISLAHSLLEKC